MNPRIEQLIQNIENVIIGKHDVIVKIICAIIAGCHVLIEDVPGVGKTPVGFVDPVGNIL